MKSPLVKGAMLSLLFVLSLDVAAGWFGFGEDSPEYKKVALIVQNHCPDGIDLPMQSFADVIAAKLSEKDIRVINAHNVIGVRQNALSSGEPMPASSAKELARMLGADGYITASVLALTGEDIGSPKPVAYRIKAKIAISLADTASGAIVCGVTEPNIGKNITVDQGRENGNLFFEEVLLFAADKCSEKFLSKYETVEWNPEEGDYAKVKFTGNINGALIKIDGVAVGTIPATGKVPEGVHNLSIEYPFCVPYSMMASFVDGQTFDAQLQLNAEGIKRYNDMVKFNEEIDRLRKAGETEDYVRRKMADGEADAMRVKAVAETEALKAKAELEAAERDANAWQKVKEFFSK